MRVAKNENENLFDNRIENLSAEEIAGNGEFAVNEPDGRVIGVIYVKTGEVEHVV